MPRCQLLKTLCQINVTDHALVRASDRLCLKTNQQCRRPLRIDATKLRTAVAGNGFRLQLQNRFALLAEVTQESRFESEWETLKSSVLEAARVRLGESRRIRRDWISSFADRIERAGVKGSTEHRNLRRQVTRAIRHD